MQLRVTIGDAQTDLTIRPASLVAFERKYDMAWAEVEKDPKIEHVFFLAWDAAKRQGLHELEFDEWLDTVDDLDPVEDEAPLGPTDASS